MCDEESSPVVAREISQLQILRTPLIGVPVEHSPLQPGTETTIINAKSGAIHLTIFYLVHVINVTSEFCQKK